MELLVGTAFIVVAALAFWAGKRQAHRDDDVGVASVSKKTGKLRVGDLVRHRTRLDVGVGTLQKISSDGRCTVLFSDSTFSGIHLSALGDADEVMRELQRTEAATLENKREAERLKSLAELRAAEKQQELEKLYEAQRQQEQQRLSLQKKERSFMSERGDVCSRCGGSGGIPRYQHVEGGVCFACNGTGRS